MNSHELPGRVAVVTGASRGIGAAVARRLASAGADVALIGRDRMRLEAVADDVAATGRRALAVPLDVRDVDAIATAIAQIESALGPVSVLVNNAAAQVFALVEELSVEAFRETVEVNLVAPYAFVQAVLPSMRRRREGWIVNISSDLGYRPFVTGAAYCASKRGLIALSEVLQLELGDEGIHVTCVVPGATATGWDGVSARHPSKQGQLKPEDLADVVVWCVSQPARARIDTLVIHPMVQSSF